MKTLILIILATILIDCHRNGEVVSSPKVIIIDSCEYFENGFRAANFYNLTHKGNCKFCESRKQLETQKILNYIDSNFKRK